MAFPLNDDFESYTTGNLQGQTSPDGNNWENGGGNGNGTNFQVSTDTDCIESGSQGVLHTANTEADVALQITTSTEGVAGVYVSKQRVDSSSEVASYRLGPDTTWGNLTCVTGFGRNGGRNQLNYWLGTTVFDHGAGVADTFYQLEVEYDVSTDQNRFRLDGGTWTSWGNFFQNRTATEIAYLALGKGNSGTQEVRFDTITGDGGGASGPATLKTWNTAVKA